MDTALLIPAAVACGLATGLLPGLHVNTLTALAIGLIALDADAILFLVVVGTVHTIVNILPTTYLGAPDDDDALSLLPAHQMLLAGAGRAVVRVSVAASVSAAIIAIAAAPAYRWLLIGPWGLAARSDVLMPWILAAVVARLLLHESGQGVGGLVWAVVVWLGSGVLGLLAFDLPYEGLIPGAASPFVPLLGGLFAGAGLMRSIRMPPNVPRQAPPPKKIRLPWMPVGAAVVVSGVTAVIPGMTAAVATSLLPRTHADQGPMRSIAVLSVVNTAHALLALQVLWVLGAVRTGLAGAMDRGPVVMPETTWAAVLLIATAAGAAGTLLLDAAFARTVHRVRGRVVAVVGMALVVSIVVATTGWTGSIMFAAASAWGLIPVQVGVRRVHLMGCLSLPILMRAAGWP